MTNINTMNTMTIVMALQMFAEAGTLVNATTGFVNAHTGAKQEFTEGYSFEGELKTYYDTELLENARIEMYYAQFALKQVLPANHGDNVEWRQFNTFDRANKLEEGVIPTGQKFGMKVLTGSIDQYGTFVALSDRIQTRAYDPVVLAATEEMGASMAETQEVLIRDALLTNTNVLYADNITLATGAVVGATPTKPSDMECTAETMSVLTPDTVARAVAIMKKLRVPTIGGKYVAVIHPSAAYQLRKTDLWQECHKYAATTEIFNGEIGELHGCRFIENAFAPVLGGEYANKAGTMTYATYMFGKDAFGIIDPEGGAAEIIIKDKGQIGGPLEQFSTVGYKLETNGATVLYPERLMRIMSCTSFSGIDDAN